MTLTPNHPPPSSSTTDSFVAYTPDTTSVGTVTPQDSAFAFQDFQESLKTLRSIKALSDLLKSTQWGKKYYTDGTKVGILPGILPAGSRMLWDEMKKVKKTGGILEESVFSRIHSNSKQSTMIYLRPATKITTTNAEVTEIAEMDKHITVLALMDLCCSLKSPPASAEEHEIKNLRSAEDEILICQATFHQAYNSLDSAVTKILEAGTSVNALMTEDGPSYDSEGIPTILDPGTLMADQERNDLKEEFESAVKSVSAASKALLAVLKKGQVVNCFATDGKAPRDPYKSPYDG